jgi:hypothetical protein
MWGARSAGQTPVDFANKIKTETQTDRKGS